MKFLVKVNVGVRSVFCAALVIGSAILFSQSALAQPYPIKPIRIVVLSMPGSSVDIIARLIGGKLTEALGQQIIVDNRAGASGRIGAELVARSTPDGYTLLMLTGTLTIVDAMYQDLKYNLVKDFSPISLVGTTTSVLVVNPVIPATSVKELVALAKSRPGVLKYSSAGSGSSSHLPAEIFRFMTDIKLLHVPYKASTAALINTMAGEVDMTFQPLTASLQMIKSGKLRALAVTSAKRTSLIPNLPSISETVSGYEYMLWQGLIAPAKTPPAILSKLNTEVIKALNTPIVREQMAAIGNEPLGSSQKDLALFISKDLEKMREAVKLSGAKPED